MKRIKLANVLLLFSFLIISCSKAGSADIIEEPTGDGPVIAEVKSYLHRIVLMWEASNGNSQYEVRYASNSDMVDAMILPTQATLLDVDDLEAGQSYYWQLRAEMNGTWTDWSSVKRVSTASFETSVATYNILGAEHDANIEPEFSWYLRKTALRDIILQPNNSPDILGVQEARVQIEELVDLLGGEYDGHVSARSLSPQAIFWKPEKFELVKFNDDIDIFGPTISGYNNQRYITQIQLRERNTGKELLVYNLHIPEGKTGSRQEIRGIAARNIAAHAKAQVTKYKIPIVVLGDFNNNPEAVIEDLPSAPMVLKQEGFKDAFDTADERVNANYMTTVNRATSAAQIGENGQRRIDYIFTYPADQIAVTDHATIINFDGTSSTQLERPVPSDHHPVRAVLHLSY